MNNNSSDLEKQHDSIKFKKFFLLEFTRQLIKNSVPSEVLKLQTFLEKERENKIEEKKKIIREIIQDKEKNLSTSAKEIGGKTREIPSIMHASIGMFADQEVLNLNPFKNSFNSSVIARSNISSNNYHTKQSNNKIRLLIPESKFPIHIQYIKPVPINKEIELGKINPLIMDNNVNIIECYGPGENLIVQGSMGTKKTGIILNKEEIENTIQRFSRETKIPIQEGIFKVAIGRLIFLAIISDIVDSKFIIKKMFYEQERQPSPPTYRM
jgi:hypothetical protein